MKIAFRSVVIALCVFGTSTPSDAATLSGADVAPIEDLARSGLRLGHEIDAITAPMLARRQLNDEFQCLHQMSFQVMILTGEFSTLTELLTLSYAMHDPRDEEYLLILARVHARTALETASRTRNNANRLIGACPMTPRIEATSQRLIALSRASYDTILPVAARIGAN